MSFNSANYNSSQAIDLYFNLSKGIKKNMLPLFIYSNKHIIKINKYSYCFYLLKKKTINLNKKKIKVKQPYSISLH